MAVLSKNNKGILIGMFVAVATVLLAFTLSFTAPSFGMNNGTHIIAKADTAKEAFNKLQNARGGVLGDDVKNKVTNLGADAQALVLSAVITILTITTLWTTTKFTGAGDNAQAKTALKNALTFQVAGIGFLASYSGLLLFGIENLNLFAR